MKKEIATGCRIGCVTCFLLMVITIVCFAILFFSMFDNTLSQEEIFKLVNDNYSIILDDIRENDFTDTKKLNGVTGVSLEAEIIYVHCGQGGFGSETVYSGFYYSIDGLPKSSWAGTGFESAEQLKPDGEGFSIRYSNSDNYYYTKKIRDNFYYYKVHL